MSTGERVNNRAVWERLHPYFDPLVAAGDPGHPELARIDRPYSPVRELALAVRRPFGPRRDLLLGPQGSGKTTELLELVRSGQDNHLVVFLNLRTHFEERLRDLQAFEDLQPWEVLVVIGLAVYRFGVDHLGHRWTEDERQGLQVAIAAPQGRPPAELDVAALASEVALLVLDEAGSALVPGARVALKALGGVSKGFSARLGLGGGGAPLRDQDERVQRLVAAINRLILRLKDEYGRGVLLIVDGMDRARGELASRLFEESVVLTDLVCHQIYTAPLRVRQRNLRGFTPHWLRNLPVVDPASPSQPGSGVAFFQELWRERASAAGVSPDLISSAHVSRLAWASGGLVRQFCQMVQSLVELGWDQDLSGSTDPVVEDCVDAWRRRWEENITSSDITLMEGIVRTRELSGDEGEPGLLDTWCIVAYPNRSTWYYPHPLLTLRRVRTEPRP